MRYNLQNIPRESTRSPEEQRRLREAFLDMLDPGWRERERRFREAMSHFDYARHELRVLASQEGHNPRGDT